MIQSLATIKGFLETGDVPTQAQFVDIIDTLGASNIKTKVYTVGVAGTTGVNHLFTSVADSVEQSIRLGGTDIIPVNSVVLSIQAKCITGVNTGTGTADMGKTSGSTTFMAAVNIDNTDEIYRTVYTLNGDATTASSVYFSFTPSALWNALTAGKWRIWVTYIDNSTN